MELEPSNDDGGLDVRATETRCMCTHLERWLQESL